MPLTRSLDPSRIGPPGSPWGSCSVRRRRFVSLILHERALGAASSARSIC